MTKKIVSVDVDAAKAKVSEAGKKVSEGVKEKAQSAGSFVKEKLAGGRKAALSKFAAAAIKLSEKQLSALKKLQKSVAE